MIFVISVCFLFVCFGGVILFGAPYLPVLKPQLKMIFDLPGVSAGNKILDLGCGDGRVLMEAAKKGIYCVGYELNPILALIAWVRTFRYRKYVKIIWGNYWQKEWPEADFIFTFLLDRYMRKLDDRIQIYKHRPITLISFAFEVPEKKPETSKDGVYIYFYD
jgi:SAM-dependent methyltransferase